MGPSDPSVPRLEHAVAEAREVAEQLRASGHVSAARAVVGSGAIETRVKRSIAEARILHLAAHGENFDRWPLLSGFALAAGGGDDGWLGLPEILGLRTGAELVVLSACETGRAGFLTGSAAGEGARVSLADAFLFAGATHVVAGILPVDDRSTRLLMRRFYSALPRAGPIEALDTVRRELARDPAVHPSAWAGFTLTAAGRVTPPISRACSSSRRQVAGAEESAANTLQAALAFQAPLRVER